LFRAARAPASRQRRVIHDKGDCTAERRLETGGGQVSAGQQRVLQAGGVRVGEDVVVQQVIPCLVYGCRAAVVEIYTLAP
jgi:hypothetical protein